VFESIPTIEKRKPENSHAIVYNVPVPVPVHVPVDPVMEEKIDAPRMTRSKNIKM